jgi:hypothetical protein
MPPQQVLLWLAWLIFSSLSFGFDRDRLPSSLSNSPRVTNPSTLVSENVQTNDDTTVVWLSPLWLMARAL